MAEILNSIIGINEDIPVKNFRQDVYPAIDPKDSYNAQSLSGKVALITGASSGIGQAVAVTLAQAGASLALVARRQSGLEETKKAAIAAAPHANIITFTVDVRDTEAAANAVAQTVKNFGRLDILVPNAGSVTPDSTTIHEEDPGAWWNTFEVNIKGVYNFVRAALPYLREAHGRIISTGSTVAQLRVPNLADYAMSKLALERFIELIALGYPDVKAFCIHPGLIATDLSTYSLNPVFLERELEKIELPAAFVLYLAEGKADWLNGRFYNVVWDIEEVERDWKEKIIKENGLVQKLHIPK